MSLPLACIGNVVRLRDTFQVVSAKLNELAQMQVIVRDPGAEHLSGRQRPERRDIARLPVGVRQPFEPIQRSAALGEELLLHRPKVLLVVAASRNPLGGIDRVPFGVGPVEDAVEMLAEVLAFLIVQVTGNFENGPGFWRWLELCYFLRDPSQ